MQLEQEPASQPPTPAVAQSETAKALTAWLLGAGKGYQRSRDLLGDLCQRLADADVPLTRVAVSIRVLHPEIAATGYVWRPGMGAAEQVDRGHDILNAEGYLSSPIRAIHEGGGAIRRRLEGKGVRLDFPILGEMREQGATDYLCMPLRFSGSVNAMSFTTDRPGGFSAACVALFEAMIPALAAVLEIQATRRMAATLLDTYLGHEAGERVLEGEITRGGGVAIDAVVWYSDLRGFTAMSDALPHAEVIAVLNDYFECIIGVVESAGGQVLKLIGDAVLAIFPVGDPAFRDRVCDRAVEAALAAKAAMAGCNARRCEAGCKRLDFGIALHLGEVIYGNIGAPGRLDFTVIGPAVNHVTRIEDLNKIVGNGILASAAFAAACARPLASVGRHALRGVREEQEVFAVIAPETADGRATGTG